MMDIEGSKRHDEDLASLILNGRNGSNGIPGVNGAEALVRGVPLEGFWFDRTKEYAARQRGEEFGRYEHATAEALDLVPLPCWRHLSELDWRRRVAEILAEIEAETAAERQRTGIPALGAEAVQARHSHDRAKRPARSPAPRFHAATGAARRALEEAYAWFVLAYREAAAKLRAGDLTVEFPIGSFPPALPFVAACARGHPP